MKKLIIIKIFICIFSFSGVLYSYLHQQNDLMKLRIELPKLTKDILLINEANANLKYEIEAFENPKHLMSLAKRPEYIHLNYPIIDDILVANSCSELIIPYVVENSGNKICSTIIVGAR